MTIDKDSNPPKRIHHPNRPDRKPQALERLRPEGYKSGEDQDPRDDRIQGSERRQKQGRGNDPDRG